MLPTKSAIYKGEVFHSRTSPRKHAFSYTVFMVYLDLSEEESFFSLSPFWSNKGRGLAQFKRKDFHGDATKPLDESVRLSVRNALGFTPSGPVRMLANLRYFGYVMNPLVVYYCFDSEGVGLQAIVAEVNNTPWNEKHAYVLDCRRDSAHSDDERRVHTHRFDKAFTVSPFNPLNMTYCWQSSVPDKALTIDIQTLLHGEKNFEAKLNLSKVAVTGRELNRLLIQYPFFTVKVIVSIYWQAFRLFLKGVPFLGKNKTLEKSSSTPKVDGGTEAKIK